MNLTDRTRACVADAQVGELREEGLTDLIITLSDDVERTLSIEVWRGGVVVKADHIVLNEIALLCRQERLRLALCLVNHRVDVGI